MDVGCPDCGASIRSPEGEASRPLTCTVCGSSFGQARSPPETVTIASADDAGRLIGRFEITATVGEGAFGIVYRARDPQLDRIVAIKVPRGGLGKKRETDRFLREARSVSQLRHPGIVPLYEVGEADGLPFLVTHFVEGVTLADWLSSKTVTPRRAAELAVALADALNYAHRVGVVHRDLKPGNIMLDTAGNPQIMDFGLAKRDASEITVTLDGQVLGTPAYMSPEQAAGQAHRVDGRSDIYSLGVVLYQLLAGELPFRGNLRMVIYQLLNEEPRRPRALNDQVPRDLEAICLKAMAKDPARRYASAGELAQDLRRFLNREAVRARPAGWLAQFSAWAQRVQRVREAGAATVFTSMVLIAWNLYGWVRVLLGWASDAVPAIALLNLIALLLLVFVPLLLIGLGTLSRRPTAIWAGVLLLPVLLAFNSAMLLGLPYDLGGLYAEPASVDPVFSLLAILSALGWFYYIIALVAYYSNRSAMQWARSPGSEVPSSTR